MKFQSDDILNMPDLLFSKFCEEQFEINKGFTIQSIIGFINKD